MEPVCCSKSSSNCCFLTCIQISQEAGQVVWYHTLAATQEAPPHTRLHSRGSPRVPPTSRGAPFVTPSSRGEILSLRGRERIPGVPFASQEEALPQERREELQGRATFPEPPDVSVHSRETCFPCTASTFKPRIDSHHGGTWDCPVRKLRGKASWESLVGKHRGKASSESHRSPDPLEGKSYTAATAREESVVAYPHSR